MLHTISTTMGKVCPQLALESSTTCTFTCKQETFTLWMKSLVLNGKGCTVFDSNGQIAYRVDNYNCKHRAEVHLMDQNGDILFTMLKKVSKFHAQSFLEILHRLGSYMSIKVNINL